MSNPTQPTIFKLEWGLWSGPRTSFWFFKFCMGLKMTYDSDHKVCLEIGADLSGTVVKLDGWVLEDVGFYWTWSIDQMSKYVFDWLVTDAIQINSRKLSASKGWRPEEFSLDRKLVSIKITFISKHYTESWSNWRSGGRLVTAVLAVTGTTATGKLACGGGGSLGPAVTAVSAAADTRHLAVTQHHPRQHGCLGLPLCRILKCDYRLPGNRWEPLGAGQCIFHRELP